MRADISEGQVSALSKSTIELIRNLKSKYPVKIEAYISRDIRRSFSRPRKQLINSLKEFDNLGSSNVVVNIYDDLELFGERAAQALEQHGIEPVTREVTEGGKTDEREFLMGAAFTCGLEKSVTKIFEYGVPVEYELARTILTITKTKKLDLGIVKTDAPIMGQQGIQ